MFERTLSLISYRGRILMRLLQCPKFVALLLPVFCLAGIAWAEEKQDPTGTWKWTVAFNDQKRDMTLKLKLEGDKLTGAMLGRDNQEIKIDDAKFSEGTVSFSVTRERNGQKSTTKYNGKVSGDTITGKQESERGCQVRSRDWEAKRDKA